MSKWDKLLARICTLSKDIRFDELRKVLESYGYEMNALSWVGNESFSNTAPCSSPRTTAHFVPPISIPMYSFVNFISDLPYLKFSIT